MKSEEIRDFLKKHSLLKKVSGRLGKGSAWVSKHINGHQRTLTDDELEKIVGIAIDIGEEIQREGKEILKKY